MSKILVVVASVAAVASLSACTSDWMGKGKGKGKAPVVVEEVGPAPIYK
jgi:hypothetical protein